MITAVRGRSTRVETAVAIEFGASVHPFANSNKKAMSRTTQRSMCRESRRALPDV
jgi:hypothetical protein